MTQAVDWLKARAPGFNNLIQAEQDVITDFSLLWSFFESRILNTEGSARAICNAVENWQHIGALSPELVDTELAYFRNRYHSNGHFTHHFDGLRLQRSDRAPLVRAVLDGTNNDPQSKVAAVLIIIYRYRNNLFHGIKWGYEIAGQLGNFTNANSVLIKALERHGRL
jgi:hypothetical protein